MRTIRLIIEYDGTAFVGWQWQKNGPSVQAALEAALSKLTGEPIRAIASGRTDSGVHALGQVVSFDTTVAHELKAFREGLNALLPDEIAVREAAEAEPGFNALRAAKRKTYHYLILDDVPRQPLLRHRAWHFKFPLDLERMRAGAARMLGEHDFAAFCTTESTAKTTRRRVDRAEVVRRGDGLIRLEFEAPGFLHQMVRRLAGALVEVGRGAREPAWIDDLLGRAERSSAGPTAPPYGLYLVRVDY